MTELKRETMNHIGLKLPAMDPVANPTTLTHPRQLRRWVNEIPIANPRSAASMITRSLELLNRHPLPISQRPELMQCYLPVIQRFLTGIRDDALHHDRPRNEQTTRELAVSLEKIVAELAIGFKLVVAEENTSRFRKDVKKNRATGLYYAIACLSLEMIFAFADYRRLSENNWKEILELYCLGDRLNLLDEVIKDRLHESEQTTTVREILKQSLLLVLLDPLHLRQGEVWAAYDYLHQWSDEAALGPVDDQPSARGLFLVDLSDSGGPTPYNNGTEQEDHSDHLLLDVTRLNTTINGHRQLLQAGKLDDLGTSQGIDPKNPIAATQMLQHMLLAWHVIPKRRHKRIQEPGWLTATCGISGIHRMLSEQSLDSDIADLDVHKWQQRNTSASGVEIVAPASHQNFLQVGELLLLQMDKPEGRLLPRLGVVRRLAHTANGNLGAGIQFVYGQIIPATIQPSGQGAKLKLNSHLTLMVERGGNYPGNLFTSRHVYRPTSDYRVKSDNGTDLFVRSGKLVEASHSFERFEYDLR
ncbi:MAG: hypothetical protein GY703_10315 [Gammaproteobacteria bacterium]|nr:hypothetical protein [Gammaproteobacteria bacterium]